MDGGDYKPVEEGESVDATATVQNSAMYAFPRDDDDISLDEFSTIEGIAWIRSTSACHDPFQSNLINESCEGDLKELSEVSWQKMELNSETSRKASLPIMRWLGVCFPLLCATSEMGRLNLCWLSRAWV